MSLPAWPVFLYCIRAGVGNVFWWQARMTQFELEACKQQDLAGCATSPCHGQISSSPEAPGAHNVWSDFSHPTTPQCHCSSGSSGWIQGLSGLDSACWLQVADLCIRGITLQQKEGVVPDRRSSTLLSYLYLILRFKELLPTSPLHAYSLNLDTFLELLN